MRAYELMIIFEADLDDSTIQKMINGLVETVASEGGEVVNTDKWGRRRFAYEINHKNEGYYVVLEIVTEASDLNELERTLRIADQCVRHKVIRLPEHEANRRGLFGTPASA